VFQSEKCLKHNNSKRHLKEFGTAYRVSSRRENKKEFRYKKALRQSAVLGKRVSTHAVSPASS
jgi:hypothetical protein